MHTIKEHIWTRFSVWSTVAGGCKTSILMQRTLERKRERRYLQLHTNEKEMWFRCFPVMVLVWCISSDGAHVVDFASVISRFLIFVASCSVPPVTHRAKSHPKTVYRDTRWGVALHQSSQTPAWISSYGVEHHAGPFYRRGVKPRINPATYGQWRFVFQVIWICDESGSVLEPDLVKVEKYETDKCWRLLSSFWMFLLTKWWTKKNWRSLVFWYLSNLNFMCVLLCHNK